MVEKVQLERALYSVGQCRLVGLIGFPDPLRPTPELFNAAFRAHGLDWSCVILPTDRGRLREALLGLRALGFQGAEIARPYQNESLRILEKASPAAKEIGAVNLVEIAANGSLVGDNTLWQGFLASLRANPDAPYALRPLIIGAGAAARSIVYALAREGLPLTIVDEDIERAINLVHDLRHVLDEHSFSIYRWPHDLEQLAPKANLIVNTTEIGAWPGTTESPWPDGLAVPFRSLVFDLVTWPVETAFLKRARRDGAVTVDGLALLVYQAAVLFERWTGRTPPIREMWRTGTRVLQRKTLANAPRRIAISERSAQALPRDPRHDEALKPVGLNCLPALGLA